MKEIKGMSLDKWTLVGGDGLDERLEVFYRVIIISHTRALGKA